VAHKGWNNIRVLEKFGGLKEHGVEQEGWDDSEEEEEERDGLRKRQNTHMAASARP